ncbi:MAG: DNA-directed RNA polymerase subunit beta' [Bacteroidia bacterium]
MNKSYNLPKSLDDFRRISIHLASPEKIKDHWSHGEVDKAETIDYRTHKPVFGGLFCERIFGPVKDYECACGKYKRIRYKGIVCDKCGVEVTEKKYRRTRMGHIQLHVPVVHPWFFRHNPSKLALLLGITAKKLEAVVYYERYLVIQPGMARTVLEQHGNPKKISVTWGEALDEEEYRYVVELLGPENAELPDNHPDKFIAQMGAMGIYRALKDLDLDALAEQLRGQASRESSQQRKSEILRRLKVVEEFRNANKRKENHPSWVVLFVLPVIPPDLRPLIPLTGGRFTASDVNDLYRRVIQRNARLKRMMDMRAPEIMINNERRMLQESVDALIDSSKKRNQTRASAESASGGRPLKSLSESLKGKQGRFRQNLLGKRVDYSGRSVIVIGPELKLHECGLPKDMAAELFKPFVIRYLRELNVVRTDKKGRRLIDQKDPIIWPILENVLKAHPVLLNRAPTLHRLGIQAFQPKLIEGKAIQLHPLVCTGYNADFDGDQMAVHVPLSQAAVVEAQVLMLASHNILHPANGAPIAVPSQDMVLGLYYLTKERPNAPGEGMIFGSPREAIYAYEAGKIALHARIQVRLGKEKITTTVGRLIFNQILPEGMPYVNQLLTKSAIRDVIMEVFRHTDHARTAEFLDAIKELGFRTAFKAGISFTLYDVITPKNREKYIQQALEERAAIKEEAAMGLISESERYNKIIDTWTTTANKISDELMKEMAQHQDGFNPIYMMMHSGARGSKEQVRQLAALRGLMNKPQKHLGGREVIETPILSNLKEGLHVLEYFISTHGARKGLADTALKTADAGYLTRKLVDVAQDVVVTEEDCGTLRGLRITALYDENDEIVDPLWARITGRFALNDIYHPVEGTLLCKAGEEITDEIAKAIESAGIESVEIRSPLSCEAERGVCQKCYGRHLATGRLVEIGEAVGIIAAQSIGEPGTQLTLRTFHTGGTAQRIAGKNSIKAKYDGIIRFSENLKTAQRQGPKGEETVILSRGAEVYVVNAQNPARILQKADLPYAGILEFKEGDVVERGQTIVSWDPYARHIIATVREGIVRWIDLVENSTYQKQALSDVNQFEYVVVESGDRTLTPGLQILNSYGEVIESYNLPTHARIMVQDGQQVRAGMILARTPVQAARVTDITGGLPRVTELFEARSPNSAAVLSEIDGIVRWGKKRAAKQEIIIQSLDGKTEISHSVPTNKLIFVQEGDRVRAGQPLCDGSISPHDILRILGLAAVQEYLLREIQLIYIPQGVKINSKHIEVILRQMMQKVEILDSGDTLFLPEERVEKWEFMQENMLLQTKHVVTYSGDSGLQEGKMLSPAELIEIYEGLDQRKGAKPMGVRPAAPAIAQPVLMGISRAASTARSWLSAASFQDTIKVLIDAAVNAKTDELFGIKENVIVGKKIPAGTGYWEKVQGSQAAQQAFPLPLPTQPKLPVG